MFDVMNEAEIPKELTRVTQITRTQVQPPPMINPTTYMNLRTKVIFLGLALDRKFQLQKGHCWCMVNCFKIWTNPMLQY
jgi:hypothetical protein